MYSKSMPCLRHLRPRRLRKTLPKHPVATENKLYRRRNANPTSPDSPHNCLTRTLDVIGTSLLDTESAIQTHITGKTLWRSNSVYVCDLRKSKAAIVFLQETPQATCRECESKINAALE
ncbi:hypothetical protein ACJJTC_019451 [Scirpophaga incertulas]